MSLAGPIRTPTAPADGTWVRRYFAIVGDWLAAVVSRARVRAGQPPPAWGRPARILVALTLAIAVTAGLMLFVDVRTVGIEQRLSGRTQGIVAAITNFGRSGWVLLPAGLAVLALAAVCSSPRLSHMSQRTLAAFAARFGFVFLAVGAPGLVVTIGKRLIGRARPFVTHTTPFDYLPFAWNSDFASLPSGHVTSACGAAVAIGALVPRLRPLLWAFAAVIAATRIALEDHYPSDVFVAALVGAVGAILVRNWFAMRRIVFVVAEDRSVTRLPGPSLRRVTGALAQALGRTR
jgi:undecaprenyl-diphosphatase